MKKRIIALISAAAMGICGCKAEEELSVNLIDAGGASLASSGGVVFFESSSADFSFSGQSSGNSSSAVSSDPAFSSSYQSSSSAYSSSSSSITSSSSSGYQSSSSEESPSYSSSEAASSDEMSSSEASSSSYAPPVITPGTNYYTAKNYGDVKGIWISYIDLAGLYSGSESEFRSSLGAVYDNCKALGINTVYVHVRSHGDAYYSSDLFPRTKHLGGAYDPLTVMIDEAHARGLSFQAWINPLRGCSVADISRENGYVLYDWAGGETRLVEVGSYYYLNPAYDEVIKLICDGAREIVANYNVDGLHIDDYFYPTTEAYFDSSAFSASGYASLSDFRFNNCDKLVSGLYRAVKESNPSAIFGVSCQGSLYNNYNAMYADVKKWCAESGYLDYIMPQIYYGFKNSAEPYSECISTWNTIAASGNVPLITGVSASKIGCTDNWAGAGADEWKTDENILLRQYLEAIEQPSYGGICIFGYGAVFAPEYDVKEQVEKEINSLKTAISN